VHEHPDSQCLVTAQSGGGEDRVGRIVDQSGLPAVGQGAGRDGDVHAESRIRVTGSGLGAGGELVQVGPGLANLCIASVEGAILLARIDRSSEPLDVVERRIAPLLRVA
jgi:hypothetical protein